MKEATEDLTADTEAETTATTENKGSGLAAKVALQALATHQEASAEDKPAEDEQPKQQED